MTLNTIIDFLRIKQWVKNVFIISALIFSGHFSQLDLWMNCLWTMLGFCLVSSGMYIINDIRDIKEDRQHPKKAQRPLVFGTVSLKTAQWTVAVFLTIGILVCSGQGQEVLILALCYILLHIVYNLRTKHIVLLDVLTVALGFQIRIWAGAEAVHVSPSAWLQICMFVLALFLGFTKRRCEIVNLEENAISHRAVLSHYTQYFLDQMIVICAALSIVLYGLYTVSAEVTDRIHGYAMFYSTGFVVYGIFRYMYLMHVKKMGDDPSEALLSDRPMMMNIALWILFVVIVIQLSHA